MFGKPKINKLTVYFSKSKSYKREDLEKGTGIYSIASTSTIMEILYTYAKKCYVEIVEISTDKYDDDRMFIVFQGDDTDTLEKMVRLIATCEKMVVEKYKRSW